MQTPAPVDYAKATSIAHAIELLQQLGEDARPVAGGHSLLPMMKLRLAAPEALVDLNDIPELQGIRIDLLQELCAEVGIACNLRPLSEADVRGADEVMLSSATKEILPVTRIDGEPVGHGALRGKPGPVYARLYEAYQQAKLTMSI